mgnify:CR=1 FL=1
MGANSSFYSIGNLSNISVVGTVFFNNPHNFGNSFTISGIISAPPNGKPCLTLSNSGSGSGPSSFLPINNIKTADGLICKGGTVINVNFFAFINKYKPFTDKEHFVTVFNNVKKQSDPILRGIGEGYRYRVIDKYFKY